MPARGDASGEQRFYGIYRGICFSTADPEHSSRITLQVPQVLGTEVTDWAWPCRPPLLDHDHLDHKPHTPAEIVAFLAIQVTESSAGDPAHTHGVNATLVAGSGELNHDHPVTPGIPLEPEHTTHVPVPKVGDGVWVMFEAGDPDLPVWLGVF